MAATKNAQSVKNDTKEFITIALIELLKKDTLQDITISRVVSRAGVSRMAFYRNFETVQQVLYEYYDSKISSVFENMKNSSAKSDKLNSHLNFFNNFSEELILSQQQMNQWLADNGMETDTLSKKAVAELLKDASKPLGRVLSLRQQLAKSSVKKYQTMENAACADGRARGMFQFYGANRIDRWASRLIQMQKLPQNHLTDLEQARGLSMTEISPLWNCSTIISPMRGGLRHCHPRRSGLS